MARRRSPTAPLVRGLALSTLFLTNGCVTAWMWDEVHSTAGAIALTPLTVAADATLIAGYVWLMAADSDCCCSCDD